jgi:predicted transcriptional regulator
MVVVLSTLIINTVVDKGPIIFLKLAENTAGEHDGIIYS